jgi:hypothetical protein
MKKRFAGAMAGILMGISAAAAAATVEQEVESRVEALRNIKAGQSGEIVRGYNAQMDETWKYFSANRDAALPVLRRKLAAEIARPSPDFLVLLDVGHYLQNKGEPGDRELVANALFRVDPKAAIVRDNQQQLFYYTHRLADSGDPRVLPFMRAAFLEQPVTVAVPQHAMTLNSALACVFLYGLAGKAGEAQLRSALDDPKLNRTALEVLIWVGSFESRPAVEALLRRQTDYDTFVRGAAFLMTQGGPEGRDFLLALKPEALAPKVRTYLEQARPDIAKVDFPLQREQIAGIPGDTKLPDTEIRARLDAMAANAGRDEKTAPVAILDSGIPPAELIARLENVRRVTFQRISDEALSDVKINNALVNALRYRKAKP